MLMGSGLTWLLSLPEILLETRCRVLQCCGISNPILFLQAQSSSRKPGTRQGFIKWAPSSETVGKNGTDAFVMTFAASSEVKEVRSASWLIDYLAARRFMAMRKGRPSRVSIL